MYGVTLPPQGEKNRNLPLAPQLQHRPLLRAQYAARRTRHPEHGSQSRSVRALLRRLPPRRVAVHPPIFGVFVFGSCAPHNGLRAPAQPPISTPLRQLQEENVERMQQLRAFPVFIFLYVFPKQHEDNKKPAKISCVLLCPTLEM